MKRMFSMVVAGTAMTFLAGKLIAGLPPVAEAVALADEGHDHEHAGESHDLGKQEVAGHTVTGTLIGEVEAGGAVVLEIAVSGGKAKPRGLRAWIGISSGEGSARAKGVKEEDHYDAEVKAPDPIPADSKVWVELDTAAGRKKVSFDLPKQHDHKHKEGHEHEKGEGADNNVAQPTASPSPG